MDKQLTEVLNVIHQHNISYWLDSGTLLGLQRDGQLMEHDRDIDLSVWDSEEAKIKEMIPYFRQAGYQIYSASYKGKCFKYTFTPHNLHKNRIIDIDIFREVQGHAWCPMYYFNLNAAKKEKETAKKSSLLGGLRSVIRTGWKQLNTRFPLHVKIDSLPWRTFVNLGTWWIPKTYFTNIIFDDRLETYIPQEWESYLSFRYGNWQEPCDDWVFYRDDGGIQDADPGLLLDSQ
ncbi:LicD family protein [Dethiobacter alkaliphilus]|uniref:LicD/FKTN/FKRP nucleotidyltransferase domain-containing protein n=1 Tax=Dethiobacter alkaliphilus AHT 1 TaxID=555088 RepID=C0GGS4_DETAL|nr:LicD family protein [Dethiobacter alkaliphilus]EEG77515.1 hypothetical protein DealDRAFT_1638 [Dethiobacter alkaliphilus AHT 1]